MIFPTKRLNLDRSLVFIGAELLDLLSVPKTVNQLWANYRSTPSIKDGTRIITFELFNLALDFLFIVDAISISDGKICKEQI